MKKWLSILVLVASLAGWLAVSFAADEDNPEGKAEEEEPEDLKDFKSSVDVSVDTPIDFWVDM